MKMFFKLEKSFCKTPVIISMFCIVLILGCNQNPQSNGTFNNASGHSANINQSNSQGNPNVQSSTYAEKNEQQLKEELFLSESSRPLDFLTVKYTWRMNLAGQTVLEGDVLNSASMARFKNVKIKVKFFSKTDVLLKEEIFTVMEFLKPKSSASFKVKFAGYPSATEISRYEILSAETY